MGQSNTSDFGGGLSSNGNYSTPTNGTDGGGTSSISEETETQSGSTPLLYVIMLVWVVWIMLFLIWIPLLIMRNRRVSKWKKSQRRAASNNHGEATADKRNYLYQRHKESGSQMTMTLLLMFGAAVGLGLSVFANLSCDFVELDEPMILEWNIESDEQFYRIMNAGHGNIVNTGDKLRLEYYTLGMFALGSSSSESDFLGGGDGYQDTCFNIAEAETWEFGWQFQLARAASVSATLLGALSFLFLFTGCCNRAQRGYFHYLTLPFLMATILQALTLFLLDTPYCTSLVSSNNCEIGLGAVSSMSAALYWLFVTLASMTPFPPIEATFMPLSSEDECSQLSNHI